MNIFNSAIICYSVLLYSVVVPCTVYASLITGAAAAATVTTVTVLTTENSSSSSSSPSSLRWVFQ